MDGWMEEEIEKRQTDRQTDKKRAKGIIKASRRAALNVQRICRKQDKHYHTKSEYSGRVPRKGAKHTYRIFARRAAPRSSNNRFKRVFWPRWRIDRTRKQERARPAKSDKTPLFYDTRVSQRPRRKIQARYVRFARVLQAVFRIGANDRPLPPSGRQILR